MPNTLASPAAVASGPAAAGSPQGKAATISRHPMVHDRHAAAQAPANQTGGTFGATLTAAAQSQGAAAPATVVGASIPLSAAPPGTTLGTIVGASTPPPAAPAPNTTPASPHPIATTQVAAHRDLGRDARTGSTVEGSTAQTKMSDKLGQPSPVPPIPPPPATLTAQIATSVPRHGLDNTTIAGTEGDAAVTDAPAAPGRDHLAAQSAEKMPIVTGETRTDEVVQQAGQSGPPPAALQAVGSLVANTATDAASIPTGATTIAASTIEKSTAEIRSASTSAAPGASAAVSDQVTPVLIRLAAADGSRQISLHLTPHALGSVDIRIDQPKDGPAQVTLTATQPDTLALLQRDQDQLSQALDRAGLPAEGRIVAFHLAAGEPGTSMPATATPTPAMPVAAAPASPAGMAADPGMAGFSGGQAGSQSNDGRRPGFGRNSSADPDAIAADWIESAAFGSTGPGTRAGLNITA